MRFTATSLPGAFIIDLERMEDQRGSFARTYCRHEFAVMGLETEVAQCNISHTHGRGTLRGLHYQEAPYAEDKLVRCVRGRIFDVIVDLRRESPAFLRHVALDLSEANGRALYVPKGLAHGFQTLEDDSTVLYQMSQYYEPGAGRGVRWNDPAFDIRWPIDSPLLNERDASYPDFHRESPS
jgi:dTDP-4-dehydrorhamnose 3,5-epimerase